MAFAPLLPGGSGIAEEGLYAQGMEAVVAGELGAVVEGDGLAPLRGGPAGGRWCRHVGSLAGEAGEEDQAGVALMVAEVQPLPMAKGGAVGGGMGAL